MLGAVESRLPSRNGAQVWREKERSLAWFMSRLRHRARRIGRDGQWAYQNMAKNGAALICRGCGDRNGHPDRDLRFKQKAYGT